VAFGDYRIKDIDVAIYEKVRGKWKLVEKDAENDDEAMVTIKPYKDSEHNSKLKTTVRAIFQLKYLIVFLSTF